MDIKSAKTTHSPETGRGLHKKVFAAVLSCIVALVLGWSFLPIARKAQIIRAVSFGGSYATYDRLANWLRIGMTTEEVRSVLGTPEQLIEFPAGQRWIYDETGATTGWVCVVDFTTAGGIHRFNYFCNVLHIAFPTTPYTEFGNPIDDGKFDNIYLLKLRREEWQRRKRPSAANTPQNVVHGL